MKSYISYSLLAAAAATGMALAADTAYTTPVGYVTVPIPGTAGVGTQKLQLANQGLLPGGGPEAAGAAESFGSDGTGTFLQDDQGTWAVGAFVNGTRVSHVVEITSGPLQGTMTWVKSTAANKIYTTDSLATAGAGAEYRVFKTYNVATLFGDPPAATVLGGGTSVTAADNLQILDPTTNTYQTFWYKNGGAGGTGWRSTGIANADVATTAIDPNDGLVILRKQSAAGSLVISGTVKTGNTHVRVEGNAATTVLNIIATQIPVNQLTLGTSNLYTGDPVTGLKGGSSVSAADNVLIFDATTNAYTTYWYKNAGAGGTGWRATGTTSQDGFVVPSTAAILIQRKNGVSFSWNVPAVSVSAQ